MNAKLLSSAELAVLNHAIEPVLNILNKWGCSQNDKISLLDVSQATLSRMMNQPEKVRLSKDLMTRMSLILNIHQALRLIFNNPENVYGFMSMKNNNPFFNGSRPIDAAKTDVIGLYETFRNIDGLRGACV
jgi:hypothetical protein